MERLKVSEKEQQIYEGVFELLRRQVDIHAIKVSDIAQAAGVGKGTVYEYFSTKEQILAQALGYLVDREMERAMERIGRQPNFEHAFLCALSEVDLSIEDGFAQIFQMLFQERPHALCDLAHGAGEGGGLDLTMMDRLTGQLLEQGYREGAIYPRYDAYYQRMVLRGALSGYVFYRMNPGLCGAEIEPEHAKRMAYEMVIHALSEPMGEGNAG